MVLVVLDSDPLVLVLVQEEHQQEVQDVLAVRTLPGLTAIRELSDALQVSMETQRDLADQVGPNPESGPVLIRGRLGGTR